MENTQLGTIVWHDLTVPNAAEVKDFYSSVVGWTSQEFDGDFAMLPPNSEQAVTGVCYARGVNAKLPPHWLVYVAVPSVPNACEQCLKLGGTVIDGPRLLGKNLFAVIQDPAGAYLAIIES